MILLKVAIWVTMFRGWVGSGSSFGGVLFVLINLLWGVRVLVVN